MKSLECGQFVFDLLYEIIVTSSSMLFFLYLKVLERDGLPNMLEENVNKQYQTDFLYCS